MSGSEAVKGFMYVLDQTMQLFMRNKKMIPRHSLVCIVRHVVLSCCVSCMRTVPLTPGLRFCSQSLLFFTVV